MISNIVSVTKFAVLIAIILLATETHQKDELIPVYAQIGQSRLLECFDAQHRPEDKDIEEFKWDFTIRKGVNEEDIDEYEQFSHGSKRGDVIILNMTTGFQGVNLCRAKVKGGTLTTYLKYRIEIIRAPTITISSGGEDLRQLSVKANETRAFTCEAKDGNPPSNTAELFFGNKMVASVKSNVRQNFSTRDLVLSTYLWMTHEDNGKDLRCEVGSSLITEKFNQTLRLNVTFPPLLLDHEFKLNRMDDDFLNLTVTFKANPIYTSAVWTTSPNVSLASTNTEPIKLGSTTTFSSTVVWVHGDEEHNFDITFVLKVNNSQGSSQWSFDPPPEQRSLDLPVSRGETPHPGPLIGGIVAVIVLVHFS